MTARPRRSHRPHAAGRARPAPAPLPPPIADPDRGLTPEALAARVLHRDAEILILDKPAGLAVHRGPGGGDCLERYLSWLAFGLKRPPGLAHRLDRDTAGCLVLGRHPAALRTLCRLFAEGAVSKTYWAVVAGRPAEPHGRIELPLAKLSRPTGWRMVVDPAGREAVTDYRLLGSADGPDGGISWLALTPLTGRTHQIRVHCAALGLPILGDPVYGRDHQPPGARPLHLLSRAIAVPFKPDRPPVAAEAPPPGHMQDALARCGFAPAAG